MLVEDGQANRQMETPLIDRWAVKNIRKELWAGRNA
jgi:hypothetical protein